MLTGVHRDAGERLCVPLDAWEARLAAVEIDRRSLDRVVMNWLEIEGFREAAECLAEEAGLPTGGLGRIGERVAIRSAMQEGDVAGAVERVNTLDCGILDGNPSLLFHVRHQQLLELIRSGNTDGALALAQEQLGPLVGGGGEGEEDPAAAERLGALERALSLLCFEDPANSPHGDLLSPLQRQRTASQLNSAILAAQGHESDPRLNQLLRLLQWAQDTLAESVDFPRALVEGENAATAQLRCPLKGRAGR